MKIWSDFLFCGSIFIAVTSQNFLQMYYIGYLKLIKYKFVEGLAMPGCLKIWSDLANLGNKELLSKVSSIW